MTMRNFRDVSTMRSGADAGFQFEFFCQSCDRTWRSAFKPYKAPVLDTLTGRLATWVAQRQGRGGQPPDLTDSLRARQSREDALKEAAAHADRLFHQCPGCLHAVCADCWSPDHGLCIACTTAAADRQRNEAAATPGKHALACPNCGALGTGGRFCATCGFDMGITHKTCPTCGAMLARQARFCSDCGHGF